MFYIEDLEPFQGDRTVFDKVVLEEAKKDILMTLIEGHKELTAKYDDLIAGKGQCRKGPIDWNPEGFCSHIRNRAVSSCHIEWSSWYGQDIDG